MAGKTSAAGGHRIFDFAAVLLFAAALLGPAVDRFVRPAAARSAMLEWRTPAKLPKWNWHPPAIARYPQRFESWHADTFGLRDVLLRWNNRVRWFGLHTSPAADIDRGRDGWVFVRTNHELDILRGERPFSSEDLLAWQLALEAKRDWCAERGAAYVLAIAPNKSTIYPEFLPQGIVPGRTRLDQLVEWSSARSTLNLVDLRPALRAAKARDGEAAAGDPDDRSYRRMGTHWSDRGAYAALEPIRAALAAELAAVGNPSRLVQRDPGPLELTRGTVDESDSWTGRLHLGAWIDEHEYVVRDPGIVARVASKDRLDVVFERPGDAGGRPRAVVLHDSFGTQIRRFLADEFTTASFFWDYAFDEERIAAAQPDVVLELIVERALGFLAPQWPATAAEERARERFAVAQNGASTAPLLWRLGADPRRLSLYGRGTLQAAADGAGLVLETRGGDGGVLLPIPSAPAGASLLLRIEIESEPPGRATLVGRPGDESEFDPRRGSARDVGAGRATLHYEIIERAGDGPLLFLPSRGAGKHVLRSIEARALALEELP